MDEDPDETPDLVKDPHFANSDEEEMQDVEHLEVSEKTKFFWRKNAHRVCPTVY